MKRRNLYHISLVVLLSMFTFSACDNDEVLIPESSSVELWDEISSIEDYSVFVEAINHFGLDSLFQTGDDYTVFIPTNAALENYDYANDPLAESVFKYHIINFPLLLNSMPDSRNILTVSGKYALLEKGADTYSYGGVEVGKGSALYMHGRYYELSSLAEPSPTIAEYLSVNSPSLYAYISTQDSTYLDMEKSEYIGNDPVTGEPIYDEVYSTVNVFYENVFNIEETTREDFATFLMFNEQQYEEAQAEMALYLGIDYLPEEWLNNVFFPDYITSAVFYGMVNFEDLSGVNLLRNTVGDYVSYDTDNIDDDSKQTASNGLCYTTQDFGFDLDKYVADVTLTASDFATDEGGIFFWNDNITTSHSDIKPLISDEILSVDFSEAAEGSWFEIAVPYIFPGDNYRLEIESKVDDICRISVSVNDAMLTNELTLFFIYPYNTTEIFDMQYLTSSNKSVNGTDIFEAAYNLNSFDYWVKDTNGEDLVKEYGDLRIRFEYKGPCTGTINKVCFTLKSMKLIKE